MPTISLRFYIYAALFVGAIAFFMRYDYLSELVKQQDDVIQKYESAFEAKKKDEAATNKLETKYETITKVEIQYVDRIVTKEVIKYKDRVVNRCHLDPEWVRVYNLSTEQAGASSSPSIINGSATAIGKITH